MTRINLFDRHTIQQLDWPDTVDGEYARRYLLPFMVNGPRAYIKNVETTLSVLQADSVILPLITTTYQPDNSYVCSPYNHYFSYGQEELVRLENPPLEALFRLLLKPLMAYFKRIGFDKAVMVNNWLLSTNLYPAMERSQVKVIIDFLTERFSDYPILFRSVDRSGNPQLYQSLLDFGCHMVFSRQVYYQTPQSAQHKKQFKIDRSRLRRTPYQVVDGSQLTAADVPRIVFLYNKLYLEKYSYFNPQFNDAFIKLALDNNLLTIKALRHEGQLEAVLGYFTRRGVMTCPLFGYNTDLPKKTGLYVLLSVLASLEGLHQDLRVHLSAGVGPFKRLRGGIAALEYNAVYLRHLSSRQQRSWRILKRILDTVAVPIIQTYGF